VRLATEETTVAHIDTQRDVQIEIEIDTRDYVVDQRRMTGAELLALAGAAEGNQLFRELPGHADDQPIRPDEAVELHRGEKFYTVPVGNFG
jgi:hypothetical protein